jgi:hypothetical protein
MGGLRAGTAILPVLLAAVAVAGRASAWSADGHRITGEIAWREVAPETRRALRELLPRGRFETLAEAAAWADTSARRERRYEWLEPLHYVNVDPGAERVRAPRDCNCVIGAIEVASDRLRDPEASREERVEALRLLAHFVGDVHQPLHVSHPDDLGGTTVDVRFDGRPTTLHRLWDGDLLQRRLRELGRRRGPRWRAYAQSLLDRTPSELRRQWRASRDPREWAQESLLLSREYAFAVRPGASLGDDYYRASMPAVADRLAQAGVRLAALLDAAFAPAPASAGSSE